MQENPGNIKTYTPRSKVIEAYLPDANHATVKTDGWEGRMAIIIRLDGYYWFTTDYFGSCSGCDLCLSDPHKWAEKVLSDAYCFETLEDLKTYIDNTDSTAFTSSYGPLSRKDVKEAAEELES